jgi:hypothetical protein
MNDNHNNCDSDNNHNNCGSDNTIKIDNNNNNCGSANNHNNCDSDNNNNNCGSDITIKIDRANDYDSDDDKPEPVKPAIYYVMGVLMKDAGWTKKCITRELIDLCLRPGENYDAGLYYLSTFKPKAFTAVLTRCLDIGDFQMIQTLLKLKIKLPIPNPVYEDAQTIDIIIEIIKQDRRGNEIMIHFFNTCVKNDNRKMLAAMMPLTQDLILGNNKPILKLTYNMMIFAVSNNSALMDILLPNYSCETEQIKTNFKIALKVAADNGSLSSKIIAVIKTCGYN